VTARCQISRAHASADIRADDDHIHKF